MLAFTSLLALLLPLTYAQYQSPGSFQMTANNPSLDLKTEGCVVIAQLTKGDSPLIQAMHPICPAGSPFPTDAKVNWPISSLAADGDGVASDVAIYGVVRTQSAQRAQAGCVMSVSNDQVQYLVNNHFEVVWNNTLQELFDAKTSYPIMNGTTGGALDCGTHPTLLPRRLLLPDPYVLRADDDAWGVPIQIPVDTPPEPKRGILQSL